MSCRVLIKATTAASILGPTRIQTCRARILELKSQRYSAKTGANEIKRLTEAQGRQRDLNRRARLRCGYLPVSTFADNLDFEIVDATSGGDRVRRPHGRRILVVFAVACEETRE